MADEALPDRQTFEDLLPAERRERLVDWFRANPAGSSQDLARMFATSISTIRRDLDILAGDGLVRRTHGGAVRVRHHATDEFSTDLARRTAVEERTAIVREAVQLLEPGNSVLIDSGATPHTLAAEIARLELPLTVVTNDLHVAHKLAYKDAIRLIVPGGANRPGSYTLVGEPGLSFLKDIRCDRFFIAPHAIDTECVSDTTVEVALLRRAMIRSASQTILLADSSRFAARAIYRIAPLDQLHHVITDDGLPREDRDRIEDCGLRLTIAGTAPSVGESP